MKSSDFQYKRPETLHDALTYLSDDTIDCQPLAGGQSLLPLMNLRMAAPDVLLDLNRLAELDFIRMSDSHIEIGAMVNYSDLAASEHVQKSIPLMMLALPHIAHSAIRNRGTIGGSTALADPAAEIPALLIALDATISVVSLDQRRDIPAEDFFLGIYETALESDELICSIRVPVAGADQRFGFYELARRHGDFALAGTAISAGGTDPYRDLRIVFFGVGEKAMRAKAVESVLNGKHHTDSAAWRLAQDALSSLEFHDDVNASSHVKAHWAQIAMKRALHSLCQEEQ
ncbi:MAG: xanthine dehydrogenase family protein subunit M [Granulosicoccus sp.]|nr:xanthine dehydrogenase family protein subunit M [Granulosicoccus sp.]